MQKVFRHTLLAERQAARKAAKRHGKNVKIFLKSNNEQKVYAGRYQATLLKRERLNRREDWDLGPIKPRRDVGDAKGKYGATDGAYMKGLPVLRSDKDAILEPFGGSVKHLPLRRGDRVVLLSGHDKGKIGMIKTIDLTRLQVTIDGLNRVEVEVPKAMRQAEDPDQRPVQVYEKPIAITDVRLVVPMPNDEGVMRDAIIRKLEIKRIFDRDTRQNVYLRAVAGTGQNIPYPKDPNPRVRPPVEDKASDTLRIDVENKTYIPTLLRPPMPRSVIDELRNKYSVFRTRHDPEYIASKEAEEKEKEEKKKSIKLMKTPLNIANRAERRLRRKIGKKQVLSPTILEKIGRIMAAKKDLVLKEHAEKVGQSLLA
ncbi:putative 54S ribosomal protein L40, mitochondrial [Amylocarpus encephaloides]|uniref:54S ribosomal protein L40, mitochondrial n=1 Tax=Amylocarpus encephaloides TaxID=45428 RepID=A0A9P8C072_9HELO|nr:putative 54S ribosomal protein L40, mitochondrial [Amylocarpus encephaloides]